MSINFEKLKYGQYVAMRVDEKRKELSSQITKKFYEHVDCDKSSVNIKYSRIRSALESISKYQTECAEFDGVCEEYLAAIQRLVVERESDVTRVAQVADDVKRIVKELDERHAVVLTNAQESRKTTDDLLSDINGHSILEDFKKLSIGHDETAQRDNDEDCKLLEAGKTQTNKIDCFESSLSNNEEQYSNIATETEACENDREKIKDDTDNLKKKIIMLQEDLQLEDDKCTQIEAAAQTQKATDEAQLVQGEEELKTMSEEMRECVENTSSLKKDIHHAVKEHIQETEKLSNDKVDTESQLDVLDKEMTTLESSMDHVLADINEELPEEELVKLIEGFDEDEAEQSLEVLLTKTAESDQELESFRFATRALEVELREKMTVIAESRKTRLLEHRERVQTLDACHVQLGRQIFATKEKLRLVDIELDTLKQKENRIDAALAAYRQKETPCKPAVAPLHGVLQVDPNDVSDDECESSSRSFSQLGIAEFSPGTKERRQKTRSDSQDIFDSHRAGRNIFNNGNRDEVDSMMNVTFESDPSTLCGYENENVPAKAGDIAEKDITESSHIETDMDEFSLISYDPAVLEASDRSMEVSNVTIGSGSNW